VVLRTISSRHVRHHKKEYLQKNPSVGRGTHTPVFKKRDKIHASPLIETESEKPEGDGGVGTCQIPTSGAPQKGTP
jgi:hypothetical protein